MFIRTILLATLVLVCGGTAMAQRRGPSPDFWSRVSCEPLEPRTKLEALEDQHGTVIFKGFTRITTVGVRAVDIFAIEMRDVGNAASRAKGIVVRVSDLSESGPRSTDAFIDYNEIDPLLNAIDVISGVDETATKLVGFEAKYRTLGDLEISVFRQTRSGTAVAIRTGICEQSTGTLTLDDLAKVRAMIQEAKTRLDEIR